MNQNNHILILGGSLYYKHTFNRLKDRGFKIGCIDNNPQAHCKEIADYFIHCDYSNIDMTLKKISNLGIDYILPMNDIGVLSSALLSEKLSLRGISVNIAKRAVSKSLMKKQWIIDNLPTPKFFIVDNYNKAYEAINNIGVPCILKPANFPGGGSRGVIVVNKIQDLSYALSFTKDFCDDSKILIEEFMDYQSEHSIECLVKNNDIEVILIGNNYKMNLPFRVNQKITYPTNISKSKQRKLIDLCCKAIRSLGIKLGPVHIEIGFQDEKPYLIELGARAGGGAIFHPITELVTGVDYPYETVNIFLNQQIRYNPKVMNKKIEYNFITNQFPNTAVNELKEKLEKDPKIFDYHIAPGFDCTKKIETGLDRQGYLISVENI